MGHVHRCEFCGWRRSSRSATILSPQCERCGCILASVPAASAVGGVESRANVVATSRAASAAARLSAVLASAVLLAAATAVGYRHGGAAIALAALGLSGLAVVSLLLPRR